MQNQFQWLKSSGNDAPYIEIGEKKQIPENFQISRIFLEKIQKNGKFEKSEFKIKFCDVNWLGKIPNILKLAQTSQFPGISRFPDVQFPDSRKIGNLEFWVENQGQWPKLSGKSTQYI